MSVPLPPKKEVALALLERSSVHIHLDPRAEGVVVPAWFKKQPQLVLQVGLNMPVPIPDLRLDEDGMSCTLSFNRTPFFCMVPWKSVYAMVGDDSRGMVWPDDIPPEVASQARGREGEAQKRPQAARPGPVAVAPPPASSPPQGKTEPRPADARAEPEAAAASRAKKPKKRGKSETGDAPRAGTDSSPDVEATTSPARGNLVAVPAGKKTPAAIPARPRITSPNAGTPAQKPAASLADKAALAADKAAPAPAPQPAPAAAQSIGNADGKAEPKPATPRIVTPERRPSAKPKRELPPYLRVVK